MAERERSLRAEGVVLRHSDWGEADRLVILFTREQGKLRAVVKGARKLHSRKAGHMEPFTRVSLMLARGRDFWIVTQAETVDAYLPLREDLVRTASAAYVVELLDRFTYEEGQNLGLYQLLVESLHRLSSVDAPQTVLRFYDLRLLDLLGFRPELYECVHCRQPIQDEDQFFSPQQGGALCPRCGRLEPGLWPLSRRALKMLRFYQRSTYAQVRSADFSAASHAEMEGVMQAYFTYLLERTLNTPGFLRTVRRGA